MPERKNQEPVLLRISERAPIEDKTVKSAARVLQILEYFDDVQRHSTVMEISASLGFPQSSTSALLHSLVGMGYLDYDAHSRTYITSNRVALLGSWVNSDFFAEGAILSLMKEVNEQTGDAVVLAVRNGLYSQYIHVIQATSPARLHLTLGTVRSLASSGSGYALLSSMEDEEVTRLVMRINAEAKEGQPIVKVGELLDILASVRQKGYAFTCDLVTKGGGIIAAPLPQVSGQPQMVVGVGGISEVMRPKESEVANILKTQINAYLS